MTDWEKINREKNLRILKNMAISKVAEEVYTDMLLNNEEDFIERVQKLYKVFKKAHDETTN